MNRPSGASGAANVTFHAYAHKESYIPCATNATERRDQQECEPSTSRRELYVLGPGPGYRPAPTDTPPPGPRGRWTDRDGHSWPITGRHCHTCGLPLHRLLAATGATTHWLCR